MKTSEIAKPKRKEAVVLVHGLGAHRILMWPLARRLERASYRVTNWGYASTWRTIEEHGEKLARTLRELDENSEIDTLNLVTHSMGGIVAREALRQYLPKKLKRMVMMAPPNHGSYWATLFGPLLRPFCRTIDQLANRANSFVNRLPEPPAPEIGILAVHFDLLVNVASTHLAREADHVVVPGFHSAPLFSPRAAAEVIHFLQHGSFRNSRRAA